MFEDEEFRDEPRNDFVSDPNDYEYYQHIHTKDLQKTYDLVYDWRELLDKYVEDKKLDYDIILMTEAYASTTDTMRYYIDKTSGRRGAHMPFNFQLIYSFYRDAKAEDIKRGIFEWLDNMPDGEVADWVAGSHDHSRVASKVGNEKIHIVSTVVQTLPGTSVCIPETMEMKICFLLRQFNHTQISPRRVFTYNVVRIRSHTMARK